MPVRVPATSLPEPQPATGPHTTGTGLLLPPRARGSVAQQCVDASSMRQETMGAASRHPLPYVTPTSQPRRGIVGVAARDDMPPEQRHSRLRICVQCPDCGSYADIVGHGSEYRNVTEVHDPTFACTVCSWRPGQRLGPDAARPGITAGSAAVAGQAPGGVAHPPPTSWQAWYHGRLRGTLLWAVNEDHLDLLERYLETPPKRRGEVEFDAAYLRLMQRLPHGIESGRVRSDVVSLVKKLKLSGPR